MQVNEKSAKRWDYWWNGTVYDRPVMQITALIKQATSEHTKKAEENPIAKWFDVQSIFN